MSKLPAALQPGTGAIGTNSINYMYCDNCKEEVLHHKCICFRCNQGEVPRVKKVVWNRRAGRKGG